MAEQHTEMTVREALANYTPGPFRPCCLLCEDTDSLTMYFADEPSYSERLTDHVTVLRSLQTSKATGCRIKGISGIWTKLGNYIDIDTDPAISIVFLACCDDDKQDEFEELGRNSKSIGTRLRELMPACVRD